MPDMLPIFDTERGEAEYYKKVNINTKVTLPITRTGFDAILDRACAFYKIPKDDVARQIAIHWVHHFDRDENESTIKSLAKMIHKHLANSLTSLIFSELSEKAKAEKKAQSDAELANDGKADTLIPESNETAH